MATATKKEEAYSWKAGTSSGHTTKLKQSILRLLISMHRPYIEKKFTAVFYLSLLFGGKVRKVFHKICDSNETQSAHLWSEWKWTKLEEIF